jgi:hypothetical protein
VPHFSFIEGLKIALFVLAIFGTLRILALSHPDNTLSQAVLLLY